MNRGNRGQGNRGRGNRGRGNRGRGNRGRGNRGQGSGQRGGPPQDPPNGPPEDHNSDEPQPLQQEPVDIPDENQANDSGEWTPVGRKHNRSQRGASSSGNSGRGLGESGRGRAGSSQSKGVTLIGSKHTESFSSGSNRGRSQTQSSQRGRGSAAHSQRGASSSGGRSQVSPHASGSNTGGHQTTGHTNKDIVTQNYVTVQTEFLNNIKEGNYLRRTGFRDKKWMFARRNYNDRDDQSLIQVSFNPIVYIPNTNNWVKVGAVVLPFLVVNNLMYQDIIDSRIYGCFLYTNLINSHETGRGIGPLHYVRIMRSDTERMNRGLIDGVFPYYTGEDYIVLVEFNSDLKWHKPVQPRFNYTDGECEPGINELTVENAYTQMRYRSNNNLTTYSIQPQKDRHYSAIYVSKYVSLVVFFTNKKVNLEKRIKQLYSELSESNDKKDRKRLNEKKILKDKEGFHERFLIQGGGLVSIVEYPLYFRFMSRKDSKEYEFKELDSIVDESDDIKNLKSKLSGIRFPLIELNTVRDPERKSGQRMSHFAGYLLEIQNYVIEGVNKKTRAILQIPTGGGFNAYEIGGQIKNDDNVKGLKFLEEQWLKRGVKKVYEDFTGPKVVIDDVWNDTPDNDHEGYKQNDGSKSEAFPNSDDQYLGP